MRMLGVFAASALFTVLAVTPVHAQQPAGQHDHAQPPAATSPTPPAGPPPRMSGPMIDMCRQMMGGQMMGGMMDMPMMGAAGPMDPKERAAMMEMRGEMMKAMGDIMMKHARRMQGAPPAK